MDSWTREVLMKGKAQYLDLLILTGLDKILLTMQTLFTFYTASCLNEEAICTEPSFHLVFPALTKKGNQGNYRRGRAFPGGV